MFFPVFYIFHVYNRYDIIVCIMRIIGVHHRTQMSIAEVEDAITDERPDVVMVELPPDDYMKFLVVTSYLETEMKIGLISACDVGARVFLVDWEKALVEQRVRHLIGDGSPELWDKFDMGDIPGFLKRVRDEGFDLAGVQDVLINERGAVMAEKIVSIKGKHKMAVLGASHVEGVKGFLDNPATRARFIKERGIEVGAALELDCEEIYEYD
jgi:pheromone shutdown protein TraB